MFLAWHEIKKEKLRYGLVVAVIAMIAYLIFILSALALGLANENTAAVNSWQTKSVVLSQDANGDLSQSLLTQADANQVGEKQADLLALTPGILKQGSQRDSAMFVGLSKNSQVAQSISLTKGRLWQSKNEVVVSSKLADQGIKLGQKITLGLQSQPLTVVGFAKNAEYNMAPIVYGDRSQWAAIKGTTNQFVGSGFVSRQKLTVSGDNLQVATKAALFEKMPGYSAQNKTFVLMIAFLILISVVIVAIFLYILTVQKMENFAVLRAQGIPVSYLVLNTLSQTILMMAVAVVISMGLALGTSAIMPAAVPMFFNFSLIGMTGLALVVMGLLGAVIPMRLIAKIDPVTVIGG
ncbi:FtsX-like permease family protein [Fructobacillus tropaeoli]|uniref:ABC transporter permease n=1 Tax=Fructobacillus tropaeoli TaxID=709323 RepID=UPI001455DEF7|nr:FtsX-like permease family protein [Fructobacillus tropaeoli]NLS37359.1 FtsX-like permease family protein [Fructobacillus tropaeoli]